MDKKKEGMFMKYINKLGNYEAECVQEVLDLASGDQRVARALVDDALGEIRDYHAAAAIYQDLYTMYDRQQCLLPSFCRWVMRRPQPVPPQEVPKSLSPFACSVAGITRSTNGQWWINGMEKLGLEWEPDQVKVLTQQAKEAHLDYW